MIRVPGRRQNSVRYLWNGYAYHLDKHSLSTYRCALRRTKQTCPGTAVVQEDGSVVEKVMHIHSADAFEEERLAMIAEMRIVARQSNTSLREVFDDVCRDPRFANAALEVTYESVRSTLNRERSQGRPPVPQTLAALGTALEGYEPLKDFYRGSITTTQGKVALFFASDAMLAVLDKAREIHVDGTFKVVPNRPAMSQLLTVLTRYADCGYAAVCILCEDRTTEMYEKIWEKLFELAPTMQVNLETVISDFESAIITSVQRCLPTTRIRGCWFHFTQAVYRKWRKLRPATQTPADILWMAMALALIPAERVPEGITTIREASDLIAGEYPFLDRFVRYLNQQWGSRASIISVSDSPIRTNNVAENFNRWVTSKLGGAHGHVWKFCENLGKMLRTNDTEYERAANGLVRRRRESNAQLHEDARLLAAQERLASGRYTMKEFLETAVEQRRRIIIRRYDEAMERNDIDAAIPPVAAPPAAAPPVAAPRVAAPPVAAPPVRDEAEEAEMNIERDQARIEDHPAEVPEHNDPPVSQEGVLGGSSSNGREPPGNHAPTSLCCGCLEAEAVVAFIPCGHRAVCELCLHRMNLVRAQNERNIVIDVENYQRPRTQCPVCRSNYTATLRIWDC